MKKINHIILSNGSVCTLSNASSNAECGVGKYETTTQKIWNNHRNRKQNSLQMCASQIWDAALNTLLSQLMLQEQYFK